ncbi:MAG: hotdog fold thioesterase [Haloarculaceae archaeon]
MDESAQRSGTDPSADSETTADDSSAATPEAGSGADRTEIVRDLFGRIPFHEHHDVEVLMATSRRAETKLPFEEALIGDPDRGAIHGGVVSSLVDLTGAAVFSGRCRSLTPTIDLRVDFLEKAGRDALFANATVERVGSSIGVARIAVESGDSICATGTGVYRLVGEDHDR